jgi:hypothetical protein
MARRRSLSSTLFKTARIVDDIEAVESGSPAKMEHRAENVAKGRVLGKAGFWRLLFGSGRRR